jgi:hypothetical protein
VAEVRARIERDGLLVLPPGGGEVPVPVGLHEGQGEVGRGQPSVDRQRPPGRSARQRIGLRRRHQREFAQQVVAVGEADIGLRIGGRQMDRLGELVHRPVQALGRTPAPVVHAGQVEALGRERRRLGRDRDDHRRRRLGRPGKPDRAGRHHRQHRQRRRCGHSSPALAPRRPAGLHGPAVRFAGAAQPTLQLFHLGVDAASRAARQAMDRQAPLRLPAFDRALVLAEEGSDLLPGLQPRPAKLGHALKRPFPPRSASLTAWSLSHINVRGCLQPRGDRWGALACRLGGRGPMKPCCGFTAAAVIAPTPLGPPAFHPDFPGEAL